MALQELGIDFGSSFTDITSGLFGSDTATSGSGSSSQSTEQKIKQRGTERLRIDKRAIDKVIQDILGGNEGLAAIFSDEQSAGLFSSTQAQDAVGDLLAKVAGEVAKLTAVKETESAGTQIGSQQAEQSTAGSSESGGLIDSIFGGLF